VAAVPVSECSAESLEFAASAQATDVATQSG
jgi:hypothetical protein